MEEQMSGDSTAKTTMTIDATHVAPNLSEFLKTVPGSEMDVVSGYLSTAVVLFTVVTNCIVCVVLLKPHMRCSPTNVILVALSVTTTMTGVWPLPCNVYFYVLGGYRDWVPAAWCFAYDCLTDYLPTIFHTIRSIHLIVSIELRLVADRYRQSAVASRR